METMGLEQLAYTIETDRPFEEVAERLETLPAEFQFRVLAIHDVQATLAEKGFARGPLKIIELCNAGFAHSALQKSADVALFMPCKYTVRGEAGKTVVSLARPTAIAAMLPGVEIEQLALDVEKRLKAIMERAVQG